MNKIEARFVTPQPELEIHIGDECISTFNPDSHASLRDFIETTAEICDHNAKANKVLGSLIVPAAIIGGEIAVIVAAEKFVDLGYEIAGRLTEFVGMPALFYLGYKCVKETFRTSSDSRARASAIRQLNSQV